MLLIKSNISLIGFKKSLFQDEKIVIFSLGAAQGCAARMREMIYLFV
jgi:hypothetical protein